MEQCFYLSIMGLLHIIYKQNVFMRETRKPGEKFSVCVARFILRCRKNKLHVCILR